MVAALRGAGLDRPDAPVFVQSFELSNLVAMRRELGSRVPQVLLASAWEDTPYDLARPGTWPAAPQVCGAGTT